MEKYRFEKSTCEKYTIRWDNGGWAIFTIDEKGLFNCQSDYGDYQYMWPNHGRKSFKHFILELAEDSSYLLNKVSKKDYFNYEKSLKSWEAKIIELRRGNDCIKEQAREAWDFLHDLDDYSSDERLIQEKIYESEEIKAICPDEPWYTFETIMEYSLDAIYFAEKIMPMFAEILKEEIENHPESV